MRTAAPAAARHHPAGSGRTGFTLIEILLVLVLLGTLAAVVAPATLRVFDDYALKESAEAVRADLARARLSAVQEGVEYHFRSEPGGTRWVVIPGERDAGAAAEGAPVAYVPVRSGELSGGISFPEDAEAQRTGGGLDPALFVGLPDGPRLAGLRWGDPLVFLPDGTAVAGQVAVGDDRRRAIAVTVRPLTGSATVGEIVSTLPPGLDR